MRILLPDGGGGRAQCRNVSFQLSCGHTGTFYEYRAAGSSRQRLKPKGSGPREQVEAMCSMDMG
jgi:hypothetical protein